MPSIKNLLGLATLLPLLPLLPSLVGAVPCVQFDTQWNLYAFGGSQDVNLGQSSGWGSASATPLTTTGRPPWTGNNTQCLLSQFNNAMYVVGADASDFSKIYIYSFNSNTWSTQSTTNQPPSPQSRSSSVLDHDTNVIFTYSNGGLTELDMSSVAGSAQSSALAWDGVSAPSWAAGYSGGSVTAAQASNHIMYFGVPNTPAGQAQVFVVHYAYFQPTAQAFPASSGSSFPATGGQAVSVPDNGDGSPTQLVFIPNDLSSTYVINHWTNPSSYSSTDGSPYAANLINTTQTLPAPQGKDPLAAYAASPSSLVQITGNGEIYYIANAYSGGSVVGSASWSRLGYSLPGTGGGASGGSASASGSATGASGTNAPSASGSGSARSSASTSGTAASGAASASSRPSGAASLEATGSFGMMGTVGVALGAMVLGGWAVLI